MKVKLLREALKRFEDDDQVYILTDPQEFDEFGNCTGIKPVAGIRHQRMLDELTDEIQAILEY